MKNNELTNAYYDKNATTFIKSTFNCDMKKQYDMLEKYLKYGDSILDVGFGSGRDILYFSQHYIVTGIDVVDSFIDHALNLGLKNIRKLSVLDLNESDKYDGIFCCASLLHLSSNDLKLAFKNLYNALKSNGVIYVSFKYGEFEGVRNERYFNDMTLNKLGNIIKDDFIILDSMITSDVRIDRNDTWLNVILRKI